MSADDPRRGRGAAATRLRGLTRRPRRYQTQNAPIAQLYLNTLESTRRSSKVDPMNKHRRGALKVHAQKARRRKNDVGYGAREIDLTNLDTSNVATSRASFDGLAAELGADAGAPRAKVMRCSKPSRTTVTSSLALSAFTTESPTPWRPPLTP